MLRAVNIAAFCIFSVLAPAQNQWELEKENDGVQVYSKEVPGYQLKAFKAKVQIAAEIDTIYYFLLKMEHRTKWMYGTKEARLLHKAEGREYILYSIYDAPWPVTDRDMILKFITEPFADKNERMIQYSSLSHYIPINPDYVRIEKSQGSWKLRQNGNVVEVIFEGFTSNAGSLPDWVVNQVVVVSPYESLRNLKNLLQKTK